MSSIHLEWEKPTDCLDMGIWLSDGELVWLPKWHAPTRTDAKRFAQGEMEIHDWIDIRVRTVWVLPYLEFPDTVWYVKGEKDNPLTFECWEIRSR